MQGDFSILGNEFVNYISTVATYRIIRKTRQCGLLEKTSYGDLMDDLSSARRRKGHPSEPRSDDGYWVHTPKGVFEELEALGLSIPKPKPEPKKQGRKPKPKDTEAARSSKEGYKSICRTSIVRQIGKLLL